MVSGSELSLAFSCLYVRQIRMVIILSASAPVLEDIREVTLWLHLIPTCSMAPLLRHSFDKAFVSRSRAGQWLNYHTCVATHD